MIRFLCCCWRISSYFVLFQSTDNTVSLWMDFLFSDWLGQRRLPPSSIAYFRQETDDHISSPSSSSASSSSSCFFVCMYLCCIIAWQIREFSAVFSFVLPSTHCALRKGLVSRTVKLIDCLEWASRLIWLGLKMRCLSVLEYSGPACDHPDLAKLFLLFFFFFFFLA